MASDKDEATMAADAQADADAKAAAKAADKAEADKKAADKAAEADAKAAAKAAAKLAKDQSPEAEAARGSRVDPTLDIDVTDEQIAGSAGPQSLPPLIQPEPADVDLVAQGQLVRNARAEGTPVDGTA